MAQRILIAASDAHEASVLIHASRASGNAAELYDDPVEVMRALCRKPYLWAGVAAGDRVGMVSGLSLAGLARDAGFARPLLVLSGDPSPTIAIRASLLRLAVLWLPVDDELLERTTACLWPRTCAPACSARHT